MDLFSRKIVGWATSATIDGELVLDAVLRAVRRRHPRGTLIHSDHGTQFGSDTWRRFCKSSRLEPSMSRKGNCGDNAVAESFFGSLKSERIKNHIYKTRALATETILEAVEAFYNRARRHTRKLPRQVDSSKLEFPRRAIARDSALAAGFPARRAA